MFGGDHILARVRNCREDLRADWERVWRETRRDACYPETAPWSDELHAALNDDPLSGNLRELQRLAMYYMAWHKNLPEQKALSRAIKEWKGGPTFSSFETPHPFDFPKGSWNEQVRDFKRGLAMRAQEQFGTLKQASKHLKVSEKP